MKCELRKILRIFLPLLFITYMGGISFFTHTHIVNGVTIVHSHPYNSDSDHEHSTSEIELIAHFNAVHIWDTIHSGFVLAIFLILFGVILVFCLQKAFPENQNLLRSPRAPPLR